MPCCCSWSVTGLASPAAACVSTACHSCPSFAQQCAVFHLRRCTGTSASRAPFCLANAPTTVRPTACRSVTGCRMCASLWPDPNCGATQMCVPQLLSMLRSVRCAEAVRCSDGRMSAMPVTRSSDGSSNNRSSSSTQCVQRNASSANSGSSNSSSSSSGSSGTDAEDRGERLCTKRARRGAERGRQPNTDARVIPIDFASPQPSAQAASQRQQSTASSSVGGAAAASAAPRDDGREDTVMAPAVSVSESEALVQRIVKSGAMTVAERNALIGGGAVSGNGNGAIDAALPCGAVGRAGGGGGGGVGELLQLEQLPIAAPEGLTECLRRLDRCSTSNRAAQWLARCLRARLLAQHKCLYCGATAWEGTVSAYTTEPYRLLELAAILTAVPAFQYSKAAATTPWRVYRNLLSSIRQALHTMSTQRPEEFARLWTIRAA